MSNLTAADFWSTHDSNFNFADCTFDTCPIEWAYLNYEPNLGGNVAYAVIFALFLIPQAYLGIRWRTWGFLVGMIFALILEVVGYVGRLIMRSQLWVQNPFIIYIVCLTLAPAFMSAAIYLCLGRIVVVYGEHLSRLKPRSYALIFVACDLVSLILQSAGGAMSSLATDSATLNTGVNIMIAGLSFQVFSLTLFMGLWLDFILRLRKAPRSERDPRFAGFRESPKFRNFQWALLAATIFIYIRCVFRVAELQGGFDSDLFNDEITFMILEGPMIMIATGLLTYFHPGLVMGETWAAANWRFRTSKGRKGGEGEVESGSGSGSGSQMEGVVGESVRPKERA